MFRRTLVIVIAFLISAGCVWDVRVVEGAAYTPFMGAPTNLYKRGSCPESGRTRGGGPRLPLLLHQYMKAPTTRNARADAGGGGGGAGSAGRWMESVRHNKRQERFGQLLQTELGQILHRGNIKGDQVELLESALRQRISVVHVDVSPDLHQARVTVSIMAPKSASTAFGGPRRSAQVTTATSSSSSRSSITITTAGEQAAADKDTIAAPSISSDSATPVAAVAATATTGNNAVLDKRKAYSWLVRNTKPIRHALAQRIKHLKVCPNLSFVQVDVGAAVDVMYLIDKVASGYKRESLELPTDLEDEDDWPTAGDDDDGDDDDDDDNEEEEWTDVDEKFF